MHYGIIAAGEGSRLVQEGVPVPKPLVDLDGRPMIRRLMELFVANRAETISLIVNEQMTAVQEYVSGLAKELPVPLEVVVKSTPSSMHSFYELSSLMRGRGRFVLTTVDTIFRAEDFAPYVTAFANSDSDVDAIMGVTTYIEDEKPLYVDVDEQMRITAFRDTATGRDKFISGGIYGLSEPCIDVLEECLRTGVSRMRNYQRALISNGLNVRAFDMGKILDVDHASDIAIAREYLRD